MNKITFKISLLFAPIAFSFHHFEEHIIFNFREWRLLYFSDNNPLSREIDAAKDQIKTLLKKKLASGEIIIEDIISTPEIEE